MAVLNIAINARDAMPEGGVVELVTGKVHLNGDAAARGLPSGDYISVEIKDQGDGMPSHVLERATEPFFTTKAAGKGTGLGLAMASGFVQPSRGVWRSTARSVVGRQYGCCSPWLPPMPFSPKCPTGHRCWPAPTGVLQPNTF